MCSPQFEFAPEGQVSGREDLIRELYETAFAPGEQPWFLSDEATLYDIYVGDETEFIEKCRHHYGVSLSSDHLLLPVWRLVDYLEAHRRSP